MVTDVLDVVFLFALAASVELSVVRGLTRLIVLFFGRLNLVILCRKVRVTKVGSICM